ncbi:NAD dependent epimerase/dehydratase family protein [alpha proteobacterium HIMB5]|nr:NAD dependent epimerase/dehydratase family protein [alpha proteobacterium HIMB5]
MIKKKILITGASGYIGSCLANYLKKNYIVYGIDKKKKIFLIKIRKTFFCVIYWIKKN